MAKKGWPYFYPSGKKVSCEIRTEYWKNLAKVKGKKK